MSKIFNSKTEKDWDKIKEEAKKRKKATCPSCQEKDKLEVFQIDGKLICPHCKANLTRINYTDDWGGMGVVCTNEDLMGNLLASSRYNPNQVYDPLVDRANQIMFKHGDKDEIITGINKKEKKE